MKKIMFTLLALLITAAGYAKDSTAHKKTPEQVATKKADKLKKELGLSDDQRTKVYNAILERQTKVAEVKKLHTADKKSAREAIKPLNEACDTAIKNALTPEQQTKWEQMKKDQKAKHQHKKGKPKKPKQTP